MTLTSKKLCITFMATVISFVLANTASAQQHLSRSIDELVWVKGGPGLHLNDLNLRVVCSSQREDWIQELVIRGLGVSVIPCFSITTGRLGWRKHSGPLSKCRQIIIARVNGLSPQPPAGAFFSEAKKFQWQSALVALEENARPR